MSEQERTARLIGEEALQRLRRAHVAVFGLGGVGGAVVWALARCGVGRLTLVDNDAVARSNLNRQMIATRQTLGWRKVEAARRMVEAIDPAIELILVDERAQADNIERLCAGADYVADAIDDVAAKVALALHCIRREIPILSSMGTGNRLDPTRFVVTDLSKTAGDGLARAVRTRLRRAGVEHLPVVFSDEPPRAVGKDASGRVTPASISFVPPSAGLVMAGEIVRCLTEGGFHARKRIGDGDQGADDGGGVCPLLHV